jgi:hypothetical protein
MKYHQRDIVEIDFPIPGDGYKVQGGTSGGTIVKHGNNPHF